MQSHRSRNNKYLVFAESRRIHISAHSVIADTSVTRWVGSRLLCKDRKSVNDVTKFVRQ